MSVPAEYSDPPSFAGKILRKKRFSYIVSLKNNAVLSGFPGEFAIRDTFGFHNVKNLQGDVDFSGSLTCPRTPHFLSPGEVARIYLVCSDFAREFVHSGSAESAARIDLVCK